VDSVQHELDSLRELLRGQEFSLDVNTLLGVCAPVPAYVEGFFKVDFSFLLFSEI
jgi:hypothetical protein